MTPAWAIAAARKAKDRRPQGNYCVIDSEDVGAPFELKLGQGVAFVFSKRQMASLSIEELAKDAVVQTRNVPIRVSSH